LRVGDSPQPFCVKLYQSRLKSLFSFQTSLKKITEKDQIEETEDRDISKNKYDLMKKNRRRRTPEMIWEQLINSVGMGIFNVDENNQSDDDENVNNNQQQQVIHCRQM